MTDIEKYINKIERKIKRSKERLSEYENKKDSLSVHGYWSFGYYTAIVSELENLRDDLNSLMNK